MKKILFPNEYVCDSMNKRTMEMEQQVWKKPN